jgi:adenosylhomocysteine nucleosidase
MEELWGLSKSESAIGWLNVGIAGHRDLPIGEAILADKVLEAATGKSWTLQPLSGAPCQIGPVCTVDAVEERYPTNAAYEMEAASLCPGAPDALGTGLLQILKVVSDNRQSGTQQITAAFVEELIGRQLKLIEWLVGELRAKVGA